MRRILFASWFLLGPTAVWAQITRELTLPIAANTQRITYTEEVVAANVSRAALYARAKAWVTATQALTHAVLQTAQPTTGLLTAQAYMRFPLLLPGRVRQPAVVEQPSIWYTITVRVQAGRYRYVLSHYQLEVDGQRRPLETLLAPKLPPQERKAHELRLMPVSMASKAVIMGLQYAMRRPADQCPEGPEKAR
jgi:hypothetical protein